MVSRQFRVLETVGSSPAASTKKGQTTLVVGLFFFSVKVGVLSRTFWVLPLALCFALAVPLLIYLHFYLLARQDTARSGMRILREERVELARKRQA